MRDKSNNQPLPGHTWEQYRNRIILEVIDNSNCPVEAIDIADTMVRKMISGEEGLEHSLHKLKDMLEKEKLTTRKLNEAIVSLEEGLKLLSRDVQQEERNQTGKEGQFFISLVGNRLREIYQELQLNIR